MAAKRQISVWWLTGFLAALAAWLLGALIRDLDPVPAGLAVPWWALALCFAATELFVVLLRLQRGAHSISLSEIPLVVGLAFTGPVGLVAARVLGAGAVLVFHRRQRGVKLGFNLAHFALEASVAVVVYRAVLGDASPSDPRGWLAAFTATLLLDVVAALTVTAAISLHQGSYERGVVREAVQDGFPVALGNTSVALIAVLVLERNTWAAWLLVVVAAVLHIAYRAYTELGHGHARMELLYRFTSEVGQSVQADSVRRSILVQTREALSAESAQLVMLPVGDGAGTLYRLGAGDVLDASPLVTGDGEPWWWPASAGTPVLLPRRSGVTAGRTSKPPPELKDAVAAPLFTDGTAVGVLAVTDRADDVSSFDADDLRLLETLANHAKVSLDNSVLVDRLTEQAAHQEHQARHDPLTGLPNRRFFAASVTGALASAAAVHGSKQATVAVMLIDLDRFKEINDTLGHHVGDELLCEVGRRLQEELGTSGVIARLGGDEFAIVVGALSGDEEALDHAHRLHAVLERPVSLLDLEIDVRGSIGVALSPLHGNEPSVLLQRADVAMYDAKAAHSGVNLYDPDRDENTPRRLALAAELRRAIDEGVLDVFFQPKMSVGTGEVVGAEALVRWHHPRHGLLLPDEFIPLAESTGLIRPLTDLVLGAALQQAAAWRARGIDINIAVNISARNLLDADLPGKVTAALAHAGVQPAALTLEITEDSIMADPQRSLAVLGRIHAGGVRLAIDDFGTGYSSLSYLKQLPVDEVKIDKSFVIAMALDESDATIVRSTIDLGHNLGLRVVAEGVETVEAYDQLLQGGCDEAQGYLFSRPVPAEQFERWVRARRSGLEARSWSAAGRR
jgi:diguanylate cyclase (GGDEF)-like protein